MRSKICCLSRSVRSPQAQAGVARASKKNRSPEALPNTRQCRQGSLRQVTLAGNPAKLLRTANPARKSSSAKDPAQQLCQAIEPKTANEARAQERPRGAPLPTKIAAVVLTGGGGNVEVVSSPAPPPPPPRVPHHLPSQMPLPHTSKVVWQLSCEGLQVASVLEHG